MLAFSLLQATFEIFFFKGGISSNKGVIASPWLRLRRTSVHAPIKGQEKKSTISNKERREHPQGRRAL